MTDLSQAFQELRKRDHPVPRPSSLPSEAAVRAAEADAGVTFPPGFAEYLLKSSDVVVGYLEPVTLGNPGSHTYFPSVLESARAMGVPESLIPICESNGDFYCVEPSGTVVFWSHNGSSEESWPSLADWIMDVWIGEM